MSILDVTPTVTNSDQRSRQRPEDRAVRFRSIYDAAYPDIDAYCRRRLDPTTAGDAVSETFLTAWRRLDDVPSGDSARLWLFGVARRVIANQVRSTNRQNNLHLRLVDETTAHSSSAAAPADASIDAPPVIDALATLSADDAEVLRLVAWEGLSHADAGVVLDCSTNAVGVRVHRARQRLADALANQALSTDQALSNQRNEHDHD